jgi:NTE family protein
VERVAVVAAGAGARGAYEAGALSVLVPWLHASGLRPTVFAGTSAGAINATLFAAVAHEEDQHQASQQVLAAWRSLTVSKVLRSPLVSFPFKTVPRYIGQALGVPSARVISLLDTRPLRATAEALFEQHAAALHNNIHGPNPVVDALAVVATDDRDRSNVFTDIADAADLPETEPARAIDYEQASISVDHILASSAIPVLFPPVHIDGRWYIDGGVRLNVPLKPAIALGAERLAVVATHPYTYPEHPEALPATSEPDAVDGVVDVLNSVLADRMVEDLHTLEKINLLVAPERMRSGQLCIPHVFVGPATRHELGRLATEIYEQRFSGLGAIREPDFWVLEHVIGPRERGAGDLLSYLFFDPSFIDAAIAMGIEDAERVTSEADPWRDGATRGPTRA